MMNTRVKRSSVSSTPKFDFGLGVVRYDAEQNDQACSKLSDDVAFDGDFTSCDIVLELRAFLLRLTVGK